MPYKPLHDPTHLYFVTATFVEWQPLFRHHAYASIVLDSLRWHREQKLMRMYAFVVMPTHMHWICKPDDQHSINNVLQSFASFTAHEILKELRANGHREYLEVFKKHAKPGKQHHIWQKPMAKNIFSARFLHEKLEYIHNNPVAKHWRLVDSRADYRYSSACYYDDDRDPIIPIDDVRPWLA